MIFFRALFLVLYTLAPTIVYGAVGRTTQQAATASMPGPAKLHDIKDVIPLSTSFPWWYLVSAILVLTVICALIVFLLKRKKKKNQKKPLPHEQALKDLDSVRSLMTPEQSRIFAIRVADILRTYIEERFQVFQPNLTTREFLYQLTRQQGGNKILLAHNTMLQDWLNHCDMVKFAQYTLSPKEMDQMVTQVRQFVESTADIHSIKTRGRKT